MEKTIMLKAIPCIQKVATSKANIINPLLLLLKNSMAVLI